MKTEPRTVTREQIEAEIASEHCFTAAEGQAGAVGRKRRPREPVWDFETPKPLPENTSGTVIFRRPMPPEWKRSGEAP